MPSTKASLYSGSKTKQSKINSGSFSQNIAQKITGLKELCIETYDSKEGRPSHVDVNNNRVAEGNFFEDPYSDNSGLSKALKFKRKSEISNERFSRIMDSKARISINSKSGQYEVKQGMLD